jgi:hypothetical protein
MSFSNVVTKQNCIIYKHNTISQAKLLANCFKQPRDRVVLISKKRFPIADAMFPFLLNLSSNYYAAFVVISDSDTSFLWISKELKRQQSIGNFANVYPAFCPEIVIPDWWSDRDSRFLILDSDFCQNIDVFLN